MIQQYRSDLNTGLPTNFNLVNGKFQLIGGEVKAQDNINMLMAFCGGYRVYYQDFCVDVWFLFQKPTSWLQTFKNVILANFISATAKYIPFVRIKKINTLYNYNDRREIQIGVEYQYNLNRDQSQQFVTFINAQ